jgi:hypothetical protein
MDYYPTPTFSKTPYMSVEQRQYFLDRRAKLVKESPELLEFEDIHRYSGIWEQLDYKAFMRADCHQIGRHPIHLAFLMLYEYRRTYAKRTIELDDALRAGHIEIPLHECLKFELDMNKAYVESQFCVNAKKEYDKVYGETKDRANFVERLQQTINERLNAAARQQIEANLQATPSILQ